MLCLKCGVLCKTQGVQVPDLPGELNLNCIMWLNFHDKIIVLFLLNVSYISVKKFCKDRRTCGGLQPNLGLLSPSRSAVLRILTKGLLG